MDTPSDFQRLASVVRATFPAPIAVPFYASTETGGDESLRSLLSSLLRYLTLLHLRACLGGGLGSGAVEERLSMLSQPASDGRWLALLRELLRELAPHPAAQPDSVLLELLGRQGGLDLLEEAVRLRNLLVHDGVPEAGSQLRRVLHRILGSLLPLRFHRLVVPREITVTSPMPVYRATVYQGYTRPLPVNRLRTDRVLALGTVHFFRQDAARILPLSPFFLQKGESLCLLSHRSGAALVYWDPASGGTFEDDAARLEFETLRKGIAKDAGILDARHLHLEGEAHVARRLSIGADVAGRYEITAYLRSGGMADVYEARDRRTEERVAIKMLPLELTRDISTLGRFVREIDELRKVDHPRVVRYRDHGEEAGDRYLVLEFANGWSGRGREGGTAIDLGDLAKPLPESEILRLAESMAEGLQEIHSRGLFHRDLKPGNVLLFEDPAGERAMKLSDFGISTRGGGTQYTLTGFFVGTPEYMSPEQAESGGEVGPESDIYSLGVILYECLTGEVPFRGNTPFATLELHRTRRPEWPLRKNPAISRGLANLVMKCLQKDPRKRYRSARELLEDLRVYREDPAGFQEIAVVRSGDDLGDLIVGEEIGADVEGVIFTATQASTGKTLWVRAFSSAISEDRAARERVLARLKRLAGASRPGLPLIVGSGESRGTPYAVLEPVRGEVPRRLSAQEAAAALAELGRAVESLHTRGILHGRIERGVVRREGDRASFADFGWDPAAGEGAGLDGGEGFERERRAEVRALGALLHELLTGEPPGPKDLDPRRRARETPADLAAVCRRALHPGGGYGTAAELVEDLECFLGSRPLAHALPATPAYVLRLFLARHRWPVLGAALVLLSAVLAALALSRSRPRAGPSAPLSSAPRLVSFFRGSSWAASFSPDGSRIAYLNDSNGVPQVWVKDLDGGEPVRLTDGDVPADRPRWSPAGDRIVFTRREGNARSIWSMPAPPERGAPEKIIDDGYNPSWSWDGKRLVFERLAEIWTADARGGDQAEVEGIESPIYTLAWRFPAFSPDGSSLAFFQPEDGPKGRHWVLPLGGGAARPLTEEITYGGASAWMPPSGDALVFSSDRSGTTTLWMTPALGGPPQPVTTGAGEDDEPEVSRDGRRLVYTNRRVTDVLRVLDGKTGESRELWRVRYRLVLPVFSPDGNRIAFFADVGGDARLFIVESDGKSPPRQVDQGPGESNAFPRWSPDGECLYFYQVRPTRSFRKMPAGGGKSIEIAGGWSWETHYGAQVDPEERRVVYTRLEKGVPTATVIRDLQTGVERTLLPPLMDVHWSRDGQALLGGATSEVLSALGAPTKLPTMVAYLDGRPSRQAAAGLGALWSPDGASIYYLRDLPSGDGVEVRSLSLASGEERSIARLRPMWDISMFIDVSPRDEITWVQKDEGNRELWIIDLAGQ